MKLPKFKIVKLKSGETNGYVSLLRGFLLISSAFSLYKFVNIIQANDPVLRNEAAEMEKEGESLV